MLSRALVVSSVAVLGTAMGWPASGCQVEIMGKGHLKIKPALAGAGLDSCRIGGIVGGRIGVNRRNWLTTAAASNPAMLQMFRDRDRVPGRDLLPWSGEFAGKYLTSAVECYRLDRDKVLRKTIEEFAAELIATQGSDGYMGPWPKGRRLFGEGLWDLWGQYHCMLGLFKWYEESGDRKVLEACRKTADLFCQAFLDGRRRVFEAGSEEMNESCIHIFVLLYEATGEARYLALARSIEEDFAKPPSGDYVRESLAGKAFYQLPKPRWEGLHAVQGIAELYFITGDERYRRAFEQIWWSIAEFDRHNTGGFSSGEQAQGNPYDPRPIETCCTVAWMAISVDMLRMTGDSLVADELELSLFNAILGAQEPNGRWWTYNTPMDGERKAGTQDIAFQARPGSPELSCCSVNGPRGLGMLSDWAVMTAADGVALNYYGPCEFVLALPKGGSVRLVQKTDYPVSGRIRLTVSPSAPSRFVLRLRVPGWSASTRCRVNGAEVGGASAGSYLVLDREWQAGDLVELDLDMSPWLWVGERECAGKASVYHGPVLMAFDERFGPYDASALPLLDLAKKPSAAPVGLFGLRFATADGKGVTLCDFASAGMAGNRYASWLPVAGVSAAPFSRGNPLRVVRVRK